MTGATAGTEDVVIENVAVVAPAGTVTDGGTEATCGSPLARPTVVDTAAAPLSRTVPVETEPAKTLDGLRESVIAQTFSTADRVTPPAAADTVIALDARTWDVVTTNEAPVAPGLTETVPGTDAAGSLDDRLTVNPAAGAGPLKATAAADVPPPTTEVGESESVVTAGGETVNVAVRVAPP